MRYVSENVSNPQAVDKPVDNPLITAQEAFVEFCARGGLFIRDDDGKPQILTIGDFAKRVGYSERQLYRWKKTIPNFNQRVYEKMTKTVVDDMPYIYRGLKMRGMRGEHNQAKLLMQQAKILQSPPKEVKEVQITGLADIVAELTDI